MKASDLEKSSKMISQNKSLVDTIRSLKNASINGFYIDHNSLSKISIPELIAIDLKNALINRYEKLILANRTNLRLMGVDPDA